jgi:hypothetical protein
VITHRPIDRTVHPTPMASLSMSSPRSRHSSPPRARRGPVLALVAALLLGVADVPSIATQRASSQQPSVSATPGGATVASLTSGLINPRGVTFGPDGMLYVAEAGDGGADSPATLGRRSEKWGMGLTARVSRVSLQGGRTTILDRLPSATTGQDELGAADVAFLDNTLYVLTAAGGVDLGDSSFDNTVLRLDPASPSDEPTPVVNLTRYNLDNPSLSRRRDPERTNVPGGMPFGLTAFDGALYVTDGNQEHVTRITPDGQATRILEYPSSDKVLTGITVGPDKALYVAEFGPLPHKEDSGRITRLTPDGRTSVLTDRLVNVIDVAFDAGGELYALEFARTGVRKERTGRLRHVRSDGSTRMVVDGLNFPTSMAFGPDGHLYVAASGHQAARGEGEILRIQLQPEQASGLVLSPRTLALGGALAVLGLTVLIGLVLLLRRTARRHHSG